MPTDPRGGHNGELWIGVDGAALVKVTGMQDGAYDPGQNFAAAHGMDAAHGFDVPVKSKPSIKGKNIHDFAQTIVIRAQRNTERGVYSVFAFYPIGEFGDVDANAHGIRGTCWVKRAHTQSLTDAITNDIEISPALADWTPFGEWEPATGTGT